MNKKRLIFLSKRCIKDWDEFKTLKEDCKFYKMDKDWHEKKCFYEDNPGMCHVFLCPLGDEP